MPSPATLNAFVAEVQAGRFIEAMQAYYAEGATMRENLAPPRVGLANLIEHERRSLTRSTSVIGRLVGPVLHQGDYVAAQWHWTFTGVDGKVRTLEEVAWQRWEGERIVEERFFYDPAQMAAA
jgi:hypothetical protein